ncbi:hypothetical protein MAR_000171 [Mya arenaria]|uniref:Uncharacterized protein n=1 Tax=Mya arenaria TaxID=6604 RepID=A0ABY7F830_MYAAR|nr:hypothetical protein MAR_000171 [Mya arenaria]
MLHMDSATSRIGRKVGYEPEKGLQFMVKFAVFFILLNTFLKFTLFQRHRREDTNHDYWRGTVNARRKRMRFLVASAMIGMTLSIMFVFRYVTNYPSYKNRKYYQEQKT